MRYSLVNWQLIMDMTGRKSCSDHGWQSWIFPANEGGGIWERRTVQTLAMAWKGYDCGLLVWKMMPIY